MPRFALTNRDNDVFFFFFVSSQHRRRRAMTVRMQATSAIPFCWSGYSSKINSHRVIDVVATQESRTQIGCIVVFAPVCVCVCLCGPEVASAHHWTLSYAMFNLHWYRMSRCEPTYSHVWLFRQQKELICKFFSSTFFSHHNSSIRSQITRFFFFFFSVSISFNGVCGIRCKLYRHRNREASRRKPWALRISCIHTISTVTDFSFYFVFYSFIHFVPFIQADWIVLGKAAGVGTMPLVFMVKRVSRAWRQHCCQSINLSFAATISITTGFLYLFMFGSVRPICVCRTRERSATCDAI